MKKEIYHKNRLTMFGLRKQWRWRVKAANGKVIGASTEGYWNRADCVRNMEQLGRALLE